MDDKRTIAVAAEFCPSSLLSLKSWAGSDQPTLQATQPQPTQLFSASPRVYYSSCPALDLAPPLCFSGRGRLAQEGLRASTPRRHGAHRQATNPLVIKRKRIGICFAPPAQKQAQAPKKRRSFQKKQPISKRLSFNLLIEIHTDLWNRRARTRGYQKPIPLGLLAKLCSCLFVFD